MKGTLKGCSMGIVNLAWGDAMAVAGRHFDKAEQATGWTDAMRPDQLAVMQRPYTPSDILQKRKTTALLNAIEAACNSGELPHTIRSKDVIDHYDKVFIGYRLVDSFAGGTEREETFRPDPVYKPKDFVYVAAPEFKCWLAAQGVAPCQQILNWFAALAEPGPEGPPDETNDDRNLRWLNYYETEEHTRKRGAYNRTAKHFKVEPSTLRKAVDKARDERTERNRSGIKPVPTKGSTKPWAGLLPTTTVKDGKKTAKNQR